MSPSPLELARQLIACPSVTPKDAGALGVIEAALAPMGFSCERLVFSQPGTADVENLFARITGAKGGGRHFCFAGHSDVVPAGDAKSWSVDPFGAQVKNGVLYGRGAADMKGAIAAFAAAAGRFLAARGKDFSGTISLLITGDEEGPAVNGTAKVLGWMKERSMAPDACLVGEPTCKQVLGDCLKIGRRGSLNARVTIQGVQGHVAYPDRADNPIPKLVALVDALLALTLDTGSAHFEPSRLVVTSMDVGNPVANIIPARAQASFNIRFNDHHTGESLTRALHERCRALCEKMGGAYELAVEISGEAFLCPPGELSGLIGRAIKGVTGRTPKEDTGGGTSDARFIRTLCPVAEFGLVGESMHKADERVSLDDLESLSAIYLQVLEGFFPAGS